MLFICGTQRHLILTFHRNLYPLWNGRRYTWNKYTNELLRQRLTYTALHRRIDIHFPFISTRISIENETRHRLTIGSNTQVGAHMKPIHTWYCECWTFNRCYCKRNERNDIEQKEDLRFSVLAHARVCMQLLRASIVHAVSL